MKQLRVLVAALAVAACGDEPTHVFFGEPSDNNLVGTWSGMEEITTAQDNASNFTYSDSDRGFSFPVAINFDDRGRFTLFTANFPASYDYDSDRTCSGAYTRKSNTISFFPSHACRALPMTKYTIGRVLPGGISLEARSNTVGNASASYLTMRVFIRLERD